MTPQRQTLIILSHLDRIGVRSTKQALFLLAAYDRPGIRVSHLMAITSSKCQVVHGYAARLIEGGLIRVETRQVMGISTKSLAHYYVTDRVRIIVEKILADVEEGYSNA